MSATELVKLATAVIVTYQSARTAGRALEAARRCYEAGLLDTIVVDNGSTDATQEIIQREAGWADIVYAGKNIGFAKGCNLGFARVTTPYTIFINPDAEVEPDALRTLLQFMERSQKAGIAGPAIIQGSGLEAGDLQVTGKRPTPATLLSRAWPTRRPQAVSRPILPQAEPFRTGWVCGAVFMIRTELMKQLNGFDPRFFLYWEEMDVCERAERAGYEIWAVGDAVARHVGGASSSEDDTRIDGCIAKHYYQSRYYYMIKHHGRAAATLSELGEFLLLGIRMLIDRAVGRGAGRWRARQQARLLSLPGDA